MTITMIISRSISRTNIYEHIILCFMNGKMRYSVDDVVEQIHLMQDTVMFQQKQNSQWNRIDSDGDADITSCKW